MLMMLIARKNEAETHFERMDAIFAFTNLAPVQREFSHRRPFFSLDPNSRE